MEIWYLISGIISLIMIIQYFVLCANVKRIKNILESPAASTNIHLIEYKKHKFWSENEQAIVKLKDSFWYDLNLFKGMNNSIEENLKKYSELKKRYENAFNDYGIVPPEWTGKF